MESLRQYLISVAAAAIIGGVVKNLSDEKSTSGTVIRLITGLILVMTVLSPLVSLHLSDLPDLSESIMAEAKAVSSDGEELARQQMETVIMEQLEAYILDKAASHGVTLEVSFRDFDESMVPRQVILRGKVSPYVKSQMQSEISAELGIAKENQVWTG